MGSAHSKAKKLKGVNRSILSGKIINGRDAILVSEALEYVKALGYDLVYLCWEKPYEPEQYAYLLKQGYFVR